jgi:hypothetical protein
VYARSLEKHNGSHNDSWIGNRPPIGVLLAASTNTMPQPDKVLRFLWWNLDSFAHYDRGRAGEERWPRDPAQYAAKCNRIEGALQSLFEQSVPHLLAFAEITEQAALHLRERLLPKYELLSLDFGLRESQLQIAVLYDPSAGFENPDCLPVRNAPPGTRPMASLEHDFAGNRIRFYACHWTARFEAESEDTRADTARQLNIQIYRFLHEDAGADEPRHVVILGDLNEEPYGLVERRLYASRDRRRARMRPHQSDAPLERIRLYNCSWRWLGERSPHTGSLGTVETAGTYYWQRKNRWCAFDQVIVTGSLVNQTCPFLDEGQFEVAVTPEVLGGERRPRRFTWINQQPRGLSDHLPIRGCIVLEKGEQ